jgi:hypothetical protein
MQVAMAVDRGRGSRQDRSLSELRAQRAHSTSIALLFSQPVAQASCDAVIRPAVDTPAERSTRPLS